MRSAWNRLSASYQASHRISTDSAHYGPWSPPESKLNILGDMRGLHILEIGCGGGQSSIAFARQGAIPTGLDVSDEQLVFAQRLAAQESVTVSFVQGSGDDLSRLGDASCDLVFSTYALQYIANISMCLAECRRVLRGKGRLVFSLDHPMRDCFADDEQDEMSIVPTRSYFDGTPLSWTWGDTGVRMQAHRYTIAQWCDLLNAAGLPLQRIVEPEPPIEMLDAVWPIDDAMAPLRLIPQTIIFVAQKR